MLHFVDAHLDNQFAFRPSNSESFCHVAPLSSDWKTTVTFHFSESRSKTAEAASELDSPRNNWLNPPEWTREEVLEFPGSVDGPWGRCVDRATVRWIERPHPDPLPQAGEEGKVGVGTVRYPRVVARDEE